MIGIIGAMDSEVDALKNILKDTKVETISNIEFNIGRFNDKQLIIAKSGVGKVFAAMCAQTMIIKYSVGIVINTGIAGSLDKELNIGDVAIADRVVQHDIDTSEVGDELGLISGINKVYLQCDNTVVEKLKEAASTLKYKYRLGTIASGDQFIKSDKDKNFIINQFGAISNEMEGASIGQVCYVNGVKFGVVRVISDFGDNDSGDDYKKYKLLSSEISINVVKKFLEIV